MKLNNFAKHASLTLLACGLTAFASADWPQLYNGPANHDDAASSVATDAAGNVYVNGYSDDVATGRDFLTIKYDRFGNQKWVARYDSGNATNNTDTPFGMAVDASGNVYVTGTNKSVDTDDDYVTVKYDTNGVLQWANRLDGGLRTIDDPRAIGVDSMGNAFVTGTTSVISGGALMTVKYTPSGTIEWIKKYMVAPESANDSRDLVVDGDDNVIIGASSYNGDAKGYDYVTVKYSNVGTQMWAKKFDGNLLDDELSAITRDANNNVIVTGYSETRNGTFDVLTVKYDPAGTKVWERRYGTDLVSEYAGNLVAAPDGSVYIVGTRGVIGGLADILTIAYDDAGTLKWSKTYTSLPSATSGDAGIGIGLDAAGNVFVCGTAQVWHPGATFTFVTLKYTSAGAKVWTELYSVDASSGAGSGALAVDAARGKVYVAGTAFNPASGNYDFAVVKY